MVGTPTTLAEAERLEPGGEHLRVGCRSLVLHHDHRAGEVLRPRLLKAHVPAHGVPILAAGEDPEQLLIDSAAASRTFEGPPLTPVCDAFAHAAAAAPLSTAPNLTWTAPRPMTTRAEKQAAGHAAR